MNKKMRYNIYCKNEIIAQAPSKKEAYRIIRELNRSGATMRDRLLKNGVVLQEIK